MSNPVPIRKNSRRLLPRNLSLRQRAELAALALAALALFAFGGIILWASLMPIPSISDFQAREVAQSTKIYDRTGNIVLYDVHGAERRTSVPIDQINPYVREATISIEDASFYQNAGFRPLSFARAFLVDLWTRGYAQGGSTITQQVVKNALLSRDKTLPRKIEEIILALRLTHAYSKDQILNTYLNESPYGGTIYGVQEASQYYFGVDAANVDLAQSAYLAALPQSPTYYSPYGDHKSDLDARKNLVLAKMLQYSYITRDEYNQALSEPVQFKSERDDGIKAPHFVFYIREYLEQKYGVDEVQNGGLRVVTTLDYDLQQQAENIVSQDGPSLKKQFNASNTGVVAIDPKTGQILTMVGSEDYFNDAIDGQVNVTLANRQPGSSFKPFVYATAFEKGYTPETKVFDLQTQFSTSCSPEDTANDTPPCYSPQNYSGTFNGPMSLRNALAQSQNIPAIKTLYLAGVQNSLDTAQAMGITTLGDKSKYGLTLVLGGGEVNLLEMTGAYGVFANDGVKNPPVGILSVTDESGKVLESYQPQPSQVMDPQITREISDVLSDDNARSPEFGVRGPLYFDGYDVADKTGTTNDTRDAWVIGYSPSIVVGEWAGNNDNTPMVKNIAAFIVVPTWHKIMAAALSKYSSANDVLPSPAPNPNESSLPPVLQGNWNVNPAQGVHDILYWVQKNDPQAGPPTNPWSDPQYAYWDYPVQLWAAQNGYAGSGVPSSGNSGASAGTSGFQIISPQAGTNVSSMSPVIVSGSDQNPANVISVTYSLNGSPVGTVSTQPYSISFVPNSHGPATLQAVAQLDTGGTESASVNFTIQ